METHVTRRLGLAFDSETCCEYTGLALWQFPLEVQGVPSLMGYWRADGYLRRVRYLTPEELTSLFPDFQTYTAQRLAFEQWLAITRKTS